MGKPPEICALTEFANETPIARIVAHWIKRYGKATSTELLRRAIAARLAGNNEHANNLKTLAVVARDELLGQAQSDEISHSRVVIPSSLSNTECPSLLISVPNATRA